MLNSDMNLTSAEEAAVTAMTSFNLTVPPTATKSGKFTRWTETVTIEAATLERKPSSSGADHTIFILKAKVVPGGDAANVGRVIFDRSRVNYGVLKGNAAAAGTNAVDKEKTMSAFSIKKLKQIAVVAGLSLASGLTADILNVLFPSDGTVSPLVGMKVAFLLSEKEGSVRDSGESNQNVDNVFKIGA